MCWVALVSYVKFMGYTVYLLRLLNCLEKSLKAFSELGKFPYISRIHTASIGE